MNASDSNDLPDVKFDKLDRQILEALKEEGVIIPTTVEDVRRAKARLKAMPVTVPPHLRDANAILAKLEAERNVHDIAASEGVSEKVSCKAPEQFVMAVVIAELTRLLSKPEFPLGRFRYNKFAYFAQRKAEEDVSQRFLKKAAGPYSPWARYQGPERIALRNGYVKLDAKSKGLLPGDKIDSIKTYVAHYPTCRAVDWTVAKFRYVKNEELELLATVDFASVDIKKMSTPITASAVKEVIAKNEEWAPKLERETFSDQNIQRAINRLSELFPTTYE